MEGYCTGKNGDRDEYCRFGRYSVYRRRILEKKAGRGCRCSFRTVFRETGL